MHPLGCGFGSVGSAGDVDTQALQSLLVQCLLPLKSTCEAGNQCSQQGDCSRNEIRRCEDLPYRQDALYWLHGHSACVTRSVLDGGRGDSLVGLLSVSDRGKDAGKHGSRRNTEGALPVNVENSDTNNDGAQESLSEGLNCPIKDTGPE